VQVLSGTHRSTDLLERVERGYPPEASRDSRLLHELVLGVLRRRMALHALLRDLVTGGLDRVSAPVRELLFILAYQAVFLRVPAYARVSTAVDAARRLQGEPAARLVNAVGRALERRLSAASDPLAGLDAMVRFSVPHWIYRRIREAIGRDPTDAELAALDSPAATVYRVNPACGASREEVIGRLRVLGVAATPTRAADHGLVAEHGARLRDLIPATLIPQDEASQLVVQVLDPQPGERIVDLCAGTGLKTTDILARAPGAKVLAVDLNPYRVRHAQDLCRATRVEEPAFLVADARRLPASLRGWADRVLLDAPCTGLGTLRRRPEVRYVRREEDIARATHLQEQLLQAAGDLVRPGGLLVYAVCSFAPEEGEQRIASLTSTNRFHLEPARIPSPWLRPDGTVLTLPWRDPMDGFFIAACRAL